MQAQEKRSQFRFTHDPTALVSPKNQLELAMEAQGLPRHYPAGSCCYFHHVNPISSGEPGHHPNQPHATVPQPRKSRPQSAVDGRNYAKMVKKLAPKHKPIGQVAQSH